MTPSCARHQAGFTLIELLVVVAIISILASIAIPVFSRYKQQAVDSDMLSALHSARTAMEAYYVDTQSYAGVTAQRLWDDYGFRYGAGLTFEDPPKSAQSAYCVSFSAVGGSSPEFSFDSRLGRSVPAPCVFP